MRFLYLFAALAIVLGLQTQSAEASKANSETVSVIQNVETRPAAGKWTCSVGTGYKDSSYTTASCTTNTSLFTRGYIVAVQLCKAWPRDVIQRGAVKVATSVRSLLVSTTPRCGGTVASRWYESGVVPSYYP